MLPREAAGAASSRAEHAFTQRPTCHRGRGRQQALPRRHRRRLSSALARGQARRDHVRGRPLGLRQDHAPALHRRPDRSEHRQAARAWPAGRRPAARWRGHGVPAFRPAPLEDRLRQRGVRAGDGGRPAPRHPYAGHALPRARRAHRLRAPLSLPALGRDAAARRVGARAGHEPVDPAHGRAVCRARCADARDPAGRADLADGAARRTQDHGVHHPFDRRGDLARRPHRGDERAPRPHQGSARHAVRMAAQSRHGAVRSAFHRAPPAHLASAPYRAAVWPAGAEGGRVTTLDRARGDLADPPVDLSGDQARAERAAAARRHRRQLINLAIRVVSLAIALMLWEVAAWNVDPVLFTSPSKVAVAAYRMVLSGELWTYLWPSLVVLAIGFALAVVAGIGIGLLLARFWVLDVALTVYITFLYSIPSVALVPLIVLWAGFDTTAKVIILFLFAFFP